MNLDPKIQFQRECQQKYLRGLWEHREGDASRPFNGDLSEEYCQEQLDSVNYLFEKLQTGVISQAEFDYAFETHFELWWWARSRG